MAAGLSSFFPALPVLFLISNIFLLVPVLSFVRGRNGAVLLYVFWIFVGNSIYFINMLVWKGNVGNHAPVYCDLVTKIMVMLPIGIACSLMCINRLVWNISRSTELTLRDIKARNIKDTFICLGLPFAFGALHFLVQDKRFTIVEDVGCIPSTSRGIPALFLYYLPPSTICCGAASIYCVLAVINFWNRRRNNCGYVSGDDNNAITSNRYIRLVLLCTSSLLFCATFLLSTLFKNLQIGINSLSSWAEASWDFKNIDVLSRSDIDELPHVKTLLLLTLFPLSILGFHFFFFFGFGNEAVRSYQATRNSIMTPFRISKGPEHVAFRSPRSSSSGYSCRTSSIKKLWHSFTPSISSPPPVPPVPAYTDRTSRPPIEEVLARMIPPPPPFTPLTPPSPAYLAHSNSPRSSVRSSQSSLNVTFRNFPMPPRHFYHDYASSIDLNFLNLREDAASSARSRFSVWSEDSPVLERRYTKFFSWGRRPNNSI